MRSIAQVFFTEIVGKVLMGLFAILLIRSLPPESFANYTLATSIAGVAAGLLTASFNRIYIVGFESLDIARNKAAFIGIQFTFTFIVFCVVFPFWHSSPWLLVTTFAMIIGNCLFVFSTTVVQQQEKFFIFSAIKLSHAILLIMGIALVQWTWGLHSAWQPLAARAAVMALVFGVFLGRSIHWPGLFRVDEAWRTICLLFHEGFGLLFFYHAIMAVFCQHKHLLAKRNGTALRFGHLWSGLSLLLSAFSGLVIVEGCFLAQGSESGIKRATANDLQTTPQTSFHVCPADCLGHGSINIHLACSGWRQVSRRRPCFQDSRTFRHSVLCLQPLHDTLDEVEGFQIPDPGHFRGHPWQYHHQFHSHQ